MPFQPYGLVVDAVAATEGAARRQASGSTRQRSPTTRPSRKAGLPDNFISNTIHSEGLTRPTSGSRCLASIAICTLMISASPTHAQTPTGSRWWPSEWGPDDQRGAANRLTPDKVIEAVGLIKEGKIYQLGRVYEFGMPLFGNRHFSLTMPGLPTGGPLGTGQIVYNDEMVSGATGSPGSPIAIR